jgi:prevent-host-death family protein
MITVGIRNLRNSLSRYLDLVKHGEKVIITDHNRIVAEMIPPQAEQIESKMLQKYMEEQIETGSIIQATNNYLIKPKEVLTNQDLEIEKIYNETRSERI